MGEEKICGDMPPSKGDSYTRELLFWASIWVTEVERLRGALVGAEVGPRLFGELERERCRGTPREPEALGVGARSSVAEVPSWKGVEAADGRFIVVVEVRRGGLADAVPPAHCVPDAVLPFNSAAHAEPIAYGSHGLLTACKSTRWTTTTASLPVDALIGGTCRGGAVLCVA